MTIFFHFHDFYFDVFFFQFHDFILRFFKGLQDVLEWLSQEQNEVAVFDATNTTRERRRYLYQRVVVEKGFKLFFVESICNDPEIIEANILEVKVTSPDYKHFDKEQVLKDFLERIKHYEKRYETIDEDLEPNLR